MDKDYFAAIFIAIVVGLLAGYAWGRHGGKQVAEAQYEVELQELTVIVRDDVCPDVHIKRTTNRGM